MADPNALAAWSTEQLVAELEHRREVLPERIDIDEQRRWIVMGDPATVLVRGDIVLRLIEVVEAAHRANVPVPCGSCDENHVCPNTTLRDLLDGLDFGAAE